MPRKKVDSRLRTLIENGIKTNTRSVVVVVGDQGKNQVMNLHHILSKSQVKARPSVLWCYKNDLGFSTHRKKRMKEIKRLIARGLFDPDRDDPFELFVASTNIRWCYYKDSQKILGSTVGMLVLQDFSALTPNILCRTIETVEGGGLVVLLLHTMQSLKQLFTMTMDVHSRFRTESHQHVVPRFNERFILSLSSCKSCIVLDDELNVLPISKHIRNIAPVPESDVVGAGVETPELRDLKQSLEDTELVGALVGLCRTVDQAKATLTFSEAISEKSLRSTVALTAGRGRGKSAALGIAIAAAVGFGYSNIFVTSPSPENLGTLFEFVFKGLDALAFKEHMDYEAVQSTNPDFNKAIVRVNLFRAHRQTIQYVHPRDADKVQQAELVVIDEAAAIPLPVVKKLLGPYLVFMASTINGYEGTGRSLSLKLLDQLRKQQDASAVAAAGGGMGWWKDRTRKGRLAAAAEAKAAKSVVPEDPWAAAAAEADSGKTEEPAAPPAPASASGAGAGAGAGAGVGPVSNHSVGGTGRVLREVALNEPIRYSKNDRVETWLHELLCLDVTSVPYKLRKTPSPNDCSLYCVDRDALFSYHKMSEAFLQRMMSLYVSSHYKNSPNDLQLMSDAPAHRLFVLLGPVDASAGGELPDVLCVVQVALEGSINKESMQDSLRRGKAAAGDLIPWTVAQQFQDEAFGELSGARVVRIATHPSATGMGYGSKALDLLRRYYQGEMASLEETDGGEALDEGLPVDEDYAGGLTQRLKPRKKTPPLLVALTDRRPTRLHWLGVSFGLNDKLYRFWSRQSFRPVYLRQTANDITGEHTTIMLQPLRCEDMDEAPTPGWAVEYSRDFGRRLASLLSYRFRSFSPLLAYNVLTGALAAESALTEGKRAPMTASDMWFTFIAADLKRLEAYSRHMVDHHMITDLVPRLALLYFMGQVTGVRLARAQACVLVGLGLQRRPVDELQEALNTPASQLLALFNKAMRKLNKAISAVQEAEVEAGMAGDLAKGRAATAGMVPLRESLDAELAAAGKKAATAATKAQASKLSALDDDLMQYAVGGDDADWAKALGTKGGAVAKGARTVSVKTGKKGRGAGAGAGAGAGSGGFATPADDEDVEMAAAVASGRKHKKRGRDSEKVSKTSKHKSKTPKKDKKHKKRRTKA